MRYTKTGCRSSYRFLRTGLCPVIQADILVPDTRDPAQPCRSDPVRLRSRYLLLSRDHQLTGKRWKHQSSLRAAGSPVDRHLSRVIAIHPVGVTMLPHPFIGERIVLDRCRALHAVIFVPPQCSGHRVAIGAVLRPRQHDRMNCVRRQIHIRADAGRLARLFEYAGKMTPPDLGRSQRPSHLLRRRIFQYSISSLPVSPRRPVFKLERSRLRSAVAGTTIAFPSAGEVENR